MSRCSCVFISGQSSSYLAPLHVHWLPLSRKPGAFFRAHWRHATEVAALLRCSRGWKGTPWRPMNMHDGTRRSYFWEHGRYLGKSITSKKPNEWVRRRARGTSILLPSMSIHGLLWLWAIFMLHCFLSTQLPVKTLSTCVYLLGHKPPLPKHHGNGSSECFGESYLVCTINSKLTRSKPTGTFWYWILTKWILS